MPVLSDLYPERGLPWLELLQPPPSEESGGGVPGQTDLQPDGELGQPDGWLVWALVSSHHQAALSESPVPAGLPQDEAQLPRQPAGPHLQAAAQHQPLRDGQLGQLRQGDSRSVLRAATPGAGGAGGGEHQLLPDEAGGGGLSRAGGVRGLPALPSPHQNCLQLCKPGGDQHGADTAIQNINNSTYHLHHDIHHHYHDHDHYHHLTLHHLNSNNRTNNDWDNQNKQHWFHFV